MKWNVYVYFNVIFLLLIIELVTFWWIMYAGNAVYAIWRTENTLCQNRLKPFVKIKFTNPIEIWVENMKLMESKMADLSRSRCNYKNLTITLSLTQTRSDLTFKSLIDVSNRS